MTTYGVKYIGSKGALIEHITGFVAQNLPVGTPTTLLDVFTGTTRVAQAFRATGWTVCSSDLSWASEAYAHAFVMRTAESGQRIPELLDQLRRMTPKPDWITKTYCDVITEQGAGVVKMWKPANGAKADAIREQIAAWETTGHITKHEAMILVACLIFALDKVDSSVGVQQAYLKQWAARSSNALDLQDLPFPEGPAGTHIVGDSLLNVYPESSVAYVDPPYSAHSYATYYHIWDSITRWDKPAVGLKTNRRMDRVSGSEGFDDAMTSQWNSKRTALNAFMQLVDRLPVRYVVISYNDESIVPLEQLTTALKGKYPQIVVKSIPYKRNIMCQIGNAEAEGAKTKNTEVLIWVQKS